jgi:hypothetical protein
MHTRGRRRRYHIGVQLDNEVHDRARAAAERAKMSMADWIERAIYHTSWDEMRAEHRRLCEERRRRSP